MATLQDYIGITKLRDAWPKWKANVIAINTQIINHVAGTADKHAAQDITYTGSFTSKTDVKAALDQAKAEIDTIVVSASIDPEVALARQSSVKAKTFTTLDARLEETEQDVGTNTSQLAENVQRFNDIAINVLEYGAIADGLSHPLSTKYATLAAAQVDYSFVTVLTDEIDWAACQKAVNYAISLTKVKAFLGVGGVGTSSVGIIPTVLFPLGIYVFNRSLQATTPIIMMKGESSLLLCNNPTNNAFDLVCDYCDIDGILFGSFNIAVSFSNGNTDGGYLRFNKCEFRESKTQGILFNAPSSDLSLKDCKFVNFNNPPANMIKSIAGTTITLDTCWVEGNCSYMFDINAERISLINCSGVPTGLLTWVKLHSGMFSALNSRFGGESQAILVENYGGTNTNEFSTISAINCTLDITGYLIKLYNIPNNIYFKNCKLYLKTYTGFWIDPDMLSTDLDRLPFCVIDTDFAFSLYGIGVLSGRNKVLKMNNEKTIGSNLIKISDVIINQNIQVGGYTPLEYYDGCTLDKAQVDDFGHSVVKVTSTAILGTTPVADYEKPFNYGGYGLGQPAEKYYYEHIYANGTDDVTDTNGDAFTAVFHVEILTDGFYQICFYVGIQRFFYTLTKGKHVICIPCRLTDYDNQKILGIVVSNLFPGAILQIGNYRLIKGYIDIKTINTVLGDVAAPTAGILFGSWFKDDVVINIDPTELGTAGSKYIIDKWVCTISGATGTWLQMRALTGN